MKNLLWVCICFCFCFSIGFLGQALQAKEFKSGEIVSRQAFKYGAFEGRIRASRGMGAVSTFFLMKDLSWEQGQEWQEIDFEILGKNVETSYQTQIMTPGNPRTEHIENHKVSSTLNAYHTYRMEWTPDYLAFYFDGNLVRKVTDRQEYAIFLDPSRVGEMKLRMGLWAGFSNWSGIFDRSALPSEFLVNWVRVYSYQQDTGRFNLLWEDQFDSFNDERWVKADWTFEHAVNDYRPSNVSTVKGYLKVVFTAD